MSFFFMYVNMEKAISPSDKNLFFRFWEKCRSKINNMQDLTLHIFSVVIFFLKKFILGVFTNIKSYLKRSLH